MLSRTISGLKRECGISLEMPHLKRASARFEGRISLLFSNCPGVPLELQRGSQGPVHGASRKSSFHASLERPLRIPLQSLPGPKSSSGVEAATSGLLSRAEMYLGVPLGHPQRSQALVSCEAIQVCSPLKPEKQCLASCRVDHRDQCLSLEAPQGSHTCHRVLSRSLGLLSSQCRGVRCVWSALKHQGPFEMVARPLEFISSVMETSSS